MGPAAILNILVTANTGQARASLLQTEAMMKKTAATANSTAASTAASYKRLGTGLTKIGSSMTRYVTLPIAAAGAVSVKMAKDFNDSMQQVQSSAGASAQEVSKMHDEIIKLAQSGAVEFGPDQLAKGLFHIESQGFRAAKAMTILKAAAQGADLGNADLEATTRALGGVMKSLHAPASEATAIMSQLLKIVGQGDMRMEDLVGAISTGVVPAARTFGLTLRDVGAALDVMTQRGMGAQQSATRLRMTFSLMAAPGDAAKEALASIGLNADELANTLRTKNLPAAIALLAQHLEGVSKTRAGQVLSEAFGGGRTSAAIQLLVQNVDDLRTAYSGAGQDVEGFNRKLEADSRTMASRMAVVWAQLQASAVLFGEALAPVVAKLAEVIAKVASFATKIPGFTELLIGLFVAGPIIKFIGWVYKLRAAWILTQQAAIAAGTAQAGATTAGAAGGMFGGLFSKAGLLKAAKGAGLVAGGIAIADGLIGIISTEIAKRSDDLFTSLEAKGKTPDIFGFKGADIGLDFLDQGLLQMVGLVENNRDKANELKDMLETVAQTKIITPEQMERIRELSTALDLTGDQAMQVSNILASAAVQGGKLGVVLQDIGKAGAGPLQQYGSEVAKLAGGLVSELAKVKRSAFQLPPAVGSAFKSLLHMFHNSFGKMAGITKLQMGNVVRAMQQGPEQGRQAMVKVFDTMVQNLRDKMKAGKLTVEEGMAAIRKIVLKELALFGISGPGTWKAVTGPGPVAFDLGQNPPKVPKKAFGGIVPGHGTGDKVPVRAMVEPGEALAVLNKNAAQKWMAWNSAFPRFQKGGAAIPVYSGRSPGAIDDLAAAGLNIAGNAARELLKKMSKRAGGPASWRTFDALAKKFHLSIISAFRPGDSDSFHGISIGGGRARATDYSGTSKGMMGFATLMRDRYVQKLAELFYDPLGGWDNGVSIGAIGGHMDHVHVAFQQGGIAPPARNGKPHASWRKLFGSTFDKNELTTLAAFVGMRNPALMAAIAMGESSGIPGRVGDGGDSIGLWQINKPSWGGTNAALSNPITNAQYAKRVLRSQGLGAWTIYNTGAYREHLGGKVIQSALQALRGTGGAAGAEGEDKGVPTPMKLLRRLYKQLLPSTLKILTASVHTAKQHQKRAKKTKSVQDDIDAFHELQGALRQRKDFTAKNKAWLKAKETGKGMRAALQAVVTMMQALQPKPGEADEVADALEDTNLAELNALLKTQALTAQQRLAVSQAQYKTLQSTPYVGPFAGGGVVPGVGAKLATVHGGETITPKGGATTVILIEDGAVDARRIKTLSGAEAQRALRRSARRGNRPLPSHGGGM